MIENHTNVYAYGLWPLVVTNIALFLGFLLSFARPTTKIEWRSLGFFSSFIVALFVEMYGFPLSIYFLVTWLGNKYPALNPFSHENGHLLGLFFGINTGHGSLFHGLSNVLILLGGVLVYYGWQAVHTAGTNVVRTGPYRYIRHPQYLGFIFMIIGFLIQWPTIITLLMAPVLMVRYILLAKQEETDMLRLHPREYRVYMNSVPPWLPFWK